MISSCALKTRAASGSLFSSSATSHWSLKMRQPLAHQRQALVFDVIDAHPALPLMPEEAGSFEHLKVPRRRLPGVRKDRRDLSGGRCASVEIDREQHAAPSGVRQRAEDRLIRVRTRLRGAFRHQ